MTATATAEARPSVEMIDLGALHESPTNPRKTFIQSEVEELAASFKQHGVLQHILVRPWPKKAGEYEIVFGAKRYRAAKLAKLTQLPATIRTMTDAEVLETQLIENDKRSDIHPIEQAEAYEQLHTKFGYSVEQIAEKVGKSRAVVYARMKLCALAPEARKAFAEGKLNPSTALLVARIPVHALQKQATKEIVNDKNRGALSVREAAEHVQKRYMLRLVEAPFDREDTTLVAGAGACAACPKRTGNQPELFEGVSADVCTDPICFGKKKDAAWSKRTAEAKANGQAVLSQSEVKKLFPYPGSRPDGYIELDQTCYEDPKQRKWKALLGKRAPAPALARDERGDTYELISLADARRALKEAGHDFSRSVQKKAASASDRDQRNREKKAKQLRASQQATVAQMVKRAESRQPNLKWTRLFLAALIDHSSLESVAGAIKRRVLGKPGHSGEAQKLLHRAASSMSGDQLRGLAVELAVYSHIGPWNATFSKHFVEFSKFYGVKVQKGSAR